MWTRNNSYWIKDGSGHSVLHDTPKVHRDRQFQPSEYFGGECPSVYYPRLLRDSWQLIERISVAKWNNQAIFEKPLDHGWRLRKIAHAEIGSPVGKGCYWDEHQLIHAESASPIHCPGWDWAELDGNRVVWATGGKLYGGQITASGLTDAHELFNFNPMTFEPIAAPY